MKFKYKLLLDAIMAVVLVIILQYDFTGGLLHEIIGFVLIGGFVLHLIWNRRYIRKPLLKNMKDKIKLFINIILAICMIVMFITSVAISRDLLSALNIELANYMLWRTIHVICAYGMVVCITAHGILHINIIVGFLRKQLHCINGQKIWNVVSRVMAAVLAVFVLKTSVENVADSVNLLQGENSYNNTYVSEYIYGGNDTQIEATTADNGQKENESITAPSTTDNSKVSLDEYLSKLYCTGCGKHCSLLSPRCSKGTSQKNAAITQYNNM